jgi:D-cysteine desulfhydrase family pyridoxal phosphate-dependent enzyme
MRPIPRLRFAHLPTPVEALPRLSDFLHGPRLIIKRDDQTGLGMGGNKTRKLEFLLAEAIAVGAKTLVTAGAFQSNHCRQTAAAAAKFGFNCVLVLVKPVDYAANPAQHPSGNYLLDNLFGATCLFTDLENRDKVLQETNQLLLENGKRPYLIPYGGSNPTGAAGYVFAMQELVDQGINPDWIILASSSGGTQSGLLCGAQFFGYRGKILGLSVDEPKMVLEARIRDLASQTAEFLGEKWNTDFSATLVNSDYIGPGYGVFGKQEQEAVRIFAQYEGVLLDPVYTGRAAAGLVDLIRKGFFAKDETVLFLHTGGTPALFAQRYAPMLVSP